MMEVVVVVVVSVSVSNSVAVDVTVECSVLVMVALTFRATVLVIWMVYVLVVLCAARGMVLVAGRNVAYTVLVFLLGTVLVPMERDRSVSLSHTGLKKERVTYSQR